MMKKLKVEIEIDVDWFNAEYLEGMLKSKFYSNSHPYTINVREISDNMEDKGNISDGYHTFNELYEYRLLYNASMFNELAKQGLYDVHKSKRHSDGEECFGGGWFIVQAQLPTGQISNHYEMKDWDLFQIPEKEKANIWDGHTPQDVAKRLREFLISKPQYPKTYAECCRVLGISDGEFMFAGLSDDEYNLFDNFVMLKRCRDAYWKIAGEQMGLDKPWKPDWSIYKHKFCLGTDKDKVIEERVTTGNRILAFPTKEMRDVFYDAFEELINEVKELL